MPPGRALRPFERRLLEDVAAQAGVAFRNALLEAELAARVQQGEAQSAELAASRRRLVGVEDEARARLAGAIRRNVVPHLATVEAALAPPPAADHDQNGQLESLIADTELAQQELRTVCRGVFPALLARRGLVPALSAQLQLTHPHTLLDIDATAQQRLDRAVEAAAYLFCVEVAPRDRSSLVALAVDDDRLVAAVTGDIQWTRETSLSANPAVLVAWQHSRDRVAALDGSVTVRRNASGLAVTAVIPLDGRPQGVRALAGDSESGPPGSGRK
jgi:signal transduction histidine kinase